MGDAIRSIQTPDVCIVGAGPAGLTAAFALGAAGRRVVLLESGGLRSSSDAQELNDGDHEGVAYDGLAQTRHRQIGGTVNIWNVPVQDKPGAKYVPLNLKDMAGWPLSWKELRPYYVEAQALCGLGPFEYGAEYWATPARKPFQLDGTGLTSGVYQFGTAERFNRVLVNMLRNTESITLVPAAAVVGLIVEPHGNRLRGVRAVDGNGRAFELMARAVILACGAVENARLLLLAGFGRKVGAKWLGRGFMEHARDFSMLLIPNSPELFEVASFYDQHHSADGTLIGGRLALTDEALHDLALPNASMTLFPRARAGRGALNRVLLAIQRAAGRKRGRYGWSQVRSPANAFDAFQIVLNLEQRPHPWNRVELGSRSDRFGNALPRLFLEWTEQEQSSLNRLRNLLGEWFQTAKLGRLLTTESRRPDMNAHHHAGTTRMGVSPEDGVVDIEGRVFGSDNLYLAGASVFPTAGFANPTLTIVALALRLARHVDASLGIRA